MDRKVIGWTMWYLEGTEIKRYSSDDTKWNDLPQYGVQVKMIRYANPTQQELISGHDVYIWSEDEFKKDPLQHGKFGVEIEYKLFKKIISIAIHKDR